MRQVQRLGIVADAVDNGQEVLDALERAQLRRGADGLPDAGHGRLRRDARDPRARGREGGRGCRSSPSRRTRCARTSSAAARRGWTTSSPSRSTLAALANAIERAVARAAAAAGAPRRARRRRRRPAGSTWPRSASLQEDLGGPDALARIVRLFLEQLDPQAEQIDASARGGEHETLARIAHRMRSSAATLGAR